MLPDRIARKFHLGALALAAAGLAIAAPASASLGPGSAQKLHTLDVMLRVTEARCEQSGSNFAADYSAFAGSHRSTLSAASRELRNRLARRYGAQGGDEAYQRMNLAIASKFAQGHPWLGCGDLKTVAHGLALVKGSATLLEAADQIVPGSTASQFALVRD